LSLVYSFLQIAAGFVERVEEGSFHSILGRWSDLTLNSDMNGVAELVCISKGGDSSADKI
jgi:hypothetical protein